MRCPPFYKKFSRKIVQNINLREKEKNSDDFSEECKKKNEKTDGALSWNPAA